MTPAPAVQTQLDLALDQLASALAGYGRDHPGARAEAYRYSPFSLRVRVINPEFDGVDAFDRHDAVWDHLDALPDDVRQAIHLVVLKTPEEAARSRASWLFDNPDAPNL